MQRQRVFEIDAARNPQTSTGTSQPAFICDFPDVPVLPETLLLMELAIRERPIGLARVAGVIMSDLGATIQVMQLASREYGAEGPAARIEDCISDFGPKACLDAISKRMINRSSRHSEIADVWEHARVIADIAAFLAHEMKLNVTPEDATLVGLCHEVGRLPKLLGWDFGGRLARDISIAGSAVAEALSLPHCVREYFAGRRAGLINCRWTAMMDRAHEISDTPGIPYRQRSCLSLNMYSAEDLEAV